MSRKLVELLKTQDQEAKKNTLFRGTKRTVPTYEKIDNYLLVTNKEDSCRIYRIDEIVLYLIQDFKFLPLWLIQQWYKDFNITNTFSILEGFIKVNLVWLESDPTGIYLRPTKHLLNLFSSEKVNYTAIPKQFLNHKFGEAQVVFDIMSGNKHSELWNIIKENELLPTYGPLELEDNLDGALIIRENWVRTGFLDRNSIIEQDKELEIEIKAKKKFTSEFKNLKLFQIVTEENGKFDSQIPDLIVPVPREDGLPKSYAIEVELTSKGVNKYIKILSNYKDNLKFGKLFYLTGDAKIAKDITDAYRKLGKSLGTCKLYIIPYTPPAMRLDNYSFEDEENIKKVLKLNIRG